MPKNPEVNLIRQRLSELRGIQQMTPTRLPKPVISEIQKGPLPANVLFVDPSRLAELRIIKSTQYDLSKLVRYCEELNYSFENECFLAVPMLGRAILDHVPPIFGCKTFSEVANNYSAGTKSFKQSIEHLENSLRKIADAHLHVQIRKSEVLPNKTQVNFSSDLDVLLAEVVRILK